MDEAGAVERIGAFVAEDVRIAELVLRALDDAARAVLILRGIGRRLCGLRRDRRRRVGRFRGLRRFGRLCRLRRLRRFRRLCGLRGLRRLRRICRLRRYGRGSGTGRFRRIRLARFSRFCRLRRRRFRRFRRRRLRRLRRSGSASAWAWASAKASALPARSRRPNTEDPSRRG